jgi:hypothetical protein
MSTELIKLPRSGAVCAEATDQAGMYRSNEANQSRAYSANALHAVTECAFESMV